MHTLLFADLLGGFGINPLAFISQFISFVIVFLILWRFGFPVIQQTLEKRQTVIREGVENAEQAKRDLQTANEQAEQIKRRAQQEAQEIIGRAQKTAESESARIQEEAQAREQLSRLVVNLSISAAGKVISKSVDTKDNRRLVEEFVSSSQAGEQ